MQQNTLGTLPVGRLLSQFAIPSIVGLLVSSLYNIVDQIFIGWGIGYLGNAATTIAFPFTTLCLSLALLVGIGASSNFSLQLGKGNQELASRYVTNSITAMAGISVLYLAFGFLFLSRLLYLFGATPESFPYAYEYSWIILLGTPALIFSNGLSHLIRADGSPKYSMISIVAGAILNTILDPVFIFVFGWGMSGAAFATILGQYVSTAVCFFYLPRFKTVRLNFRQKFSFDLFWKTCKLGTPPFVNQVSILIVQIVLNNSLVHYGASSIYGSNIPIAAAGVCFKLNGLFVSVMVGLAQGTQPICGFNYGARQYDRVKKCIKLAFITMLILGIMVESLFQFFPEALILLFGQGEELYIQFGSIFLRTYLSTIAIAGIQSISSSFFSSIGQPVKGIILSLSRQILFYIPFALLLPAAFGLEGIFWSAPIADVLAVSLSLILVFNEFRHMDVLKKEIA